MSTVNGIVGVVLNLILAGLGFVLAPKPRGKQGLYWFALWLAGNAILPIFFRHPYHFFYLNWAFAVNLFSAEEFARTTGLIGKRRAS
ncbi:hypothetical protein HNQ07_004721 [Deinococcus metalli]|nr:hypothetical protein [Deinococcus metalli]MBB5379206.1 hypothetical protein [Deinococcus metalli]